MSKIILILSGVLFLQLSFAGSVKPTTKTKATKQKRNVSQNVDPVYLAQAQADKALAILVTKAKGAKGSPHKSCDHVLGSSDFSQHLAQAAKSSFMNRCAIDDQTHSTCELGYDLEKGGEEPSYRAIEYRITTDESGNPIKVSSVICDNRA